MKTLVESNQQKKWKSVTTLMSGSHLASSDSSRWSRKESTVQFKWKMTHSQEAKLQVLLDPAASYSGQFTIWVLVSSMTYFRKVDRYKIIKQSNSTESVLEMNLIHIDIANFLFQFDPETSRKQKTSCFGYALENFSVIGWPIVRDCYMSLHLSSFWNRTERNSPNTCQLLLH